MGRLRDAASRAVAVPKSVAVGYWRGLAYPFRGMRFVFFQHPGLVRYWIVPILITLVILAAMLWGVWQYHDSVVNLLWDEPTGEGFWVGVATFFHGVVEVLLALLLALVGFVVVLLSSSVIAAPFNDALSEEVERLITGRPGPPFTIRVLLRDVVRTVGLELAKLLLYMLIVGPLWVASLLLPVVGQVVYTIFWFVFTAMYWAVDYVDWPASRRNRGIAYRFQMLKRHFLPMLGYGTGVWLFLFVPGLNLLFMPAAVAGGTMLYLDLEGGDTLPPANRLESGVDLAVP